MVSPLDEASPLPSAPPTSTIIPDEVVQFRAEVEKLRAENTRLREQLAQQQRLESELDLLRNAILNNVSHEMKTPLLHVKAAVANLKEEFGENRLIEYATTATARLEGIIRNITLLAGSMEIKCVPSPARASVDQAMRSLRRSWAHKDHVDRVRIIMDDDLPPVNMDAQAIGTVLQLLVDNALKFSEDPLPVEVRVVRIKNAMRFEICDYGIGIPEDQVERIFEPFYQIDSSATRRFSGAGIGLAIVRLILERHKVEILVKSKPGKGSTFVFTLPYAPDF